MLQLRRLWSKFKTRSGLKRVWNALRLITFKHTEFATDKPFKFVKRKVLHRCVFSCFEWKFSRIFGGGSKKNFRICGIFQKMKAIHSSLKSWFKMGLKISNAIMGFTLPMLVFLLWIRNKYWKTINRNSLTLMGRDFTSVWCVQFPPCWLVKFKKLL